MKTTLTLVFLAALSGAAFAQQMHVSGIHKATHDDEKTYRTSFNQNIITATIGDKRYTLEQLASWFYFRFEVGKDYPVVDVSEKAVKVRVTDKKGHDSTERLNVVTVEEMPK